jgi:hypothetical protein
VRQAFGFSDEKEWAKEYGVLEVRRQGRAGSGEEEFGDFNATRRGRVTVTERPGVSPAILGQIIDQAIFLSLKDLGIPLPPYCEEKAALHMDADQAEQYRRMESSLRERARQETRWLSTWLQWALSRPNSAFRDEMVTKKVRDDDGNVVRIDDYLPLPAIAAGTDAVANAAGEVVALPNGEDPLPKEAWLVDFVKAEKAARRKVIVFCRQTGTRDIQPRLKALLEAGGARAEILNGNVSTRKREGWIEKRIGTMDALICNPKLVETGLDLVQFATIIFYEVDYDLFTMWQAMRRVWRLGQTKPVKVLFASYAGTLEEQALRLIGRKMKAAQLLYGDEVGGAIVNDDGENFLTELARTVLEELALDDIQTLFATEQVATDSPLGSPTATSARLPALELQVSSVTPSATWGQALEQLQDALEAAVLDKGMTLTRKEKRVLVEETLSVQQMALF